MTPPGSCRKAVAALLLFLVCAPGAPAGAHARGFSFGVLGDTPYFAFEEVRLEELIVQMNREPLAFVLHVGDIKSGLDRCDDALYRRRKATFERIAHPFILLPGDNDWADCHRASNGGFDPRERLAFFRQLFYSGGAAAAKLQVERQREAAGGQAYPENARWLHAGVLFVTLHVTGSRNNFGRDAPADQEYRDRSTANRAWLRAAFESAARGSARAVVVAIHANPRFEARPGSRARRGYDDFVRQLEEEAAAFGAPVLIVHGDTHRYRYDPRLVLDGGRQLANVARLETFGSPTAGWLKVEFDPAATPPFRVQPRR
jgi:hypothetical protein